MNTFFFLHNGHFFFACSAYVKIGLKIEKNVDLVPGENQKVMYLIELMDGQSSLEMYFLRNAKLPEYKSKRGLIRNVVMEQSKNKVTVTFFFSYISEEVF